MVRSILHAAIPAVTVALAAGCRGAPTPELAGSPVSLPPTRTPLAATVVPEQSPTPAPLPPTPTRRAEPSVTPGAEATRAASPSPTLTPTPEETEAPAPSTAIGQLDAGMIGRETTVEGRVSGAASFSAGFKFILDDNTGRVVLLLWHSVYDECPTAPGLNLGALVRATGEVGQFDGELQVQPASGAAVQVVEPAAAWAEPRPASSLGAADEGLRVMIEGEVVRVEGLQSAVKVFLRDDTGEILVFVWRSILDRIPHNTGLGTEGSRVRVVGTVTLFEGTLEVVPTVPYDVTVLDAR